MAVVDDKLNEILRGKRLLVVWALSTLLVGVIAGMVFEVPKYYRLARSGVAVHGYITDLQPLNHASVIYRYEVGGRVYEGAGHAGDIHLQFDQLKPGQSVEVFSDSNKEEVSCLGDPSKHLRSMLVLTGFIMCSPTLLLVALEIRRILKW